MQRTLLWRMSNVSADGTSLRAGVLEQEHCAQESAHLVGLIVHGVGQKIDSFAATCLGPD